MDEKEIIESLKEKLNFIKKVYHVKELGIFGSYAKADQTEDSDIDIIVDFNIGNSDLFNAARLKFYLEELLKKEVDLIYSKGIKPDLRDNIMREMKYV
jgi:uncharacterized protein